MNKQKFIDVVINPDGTIEIDQIGYEGKTCSGEVDDLIKVLGMEVRKDKKPEYYKQQKVMIQQRH